MIAGFWLAVSGVLSLRHPGSPSLRWILILGTVLIADLVAAGWGLNPSTPRSVYEGRSALAAQVDDGHRVMMPAEAEYIIKFEYSHRFDSFQPGLDLSALRATGLPNLTVLDGLPSANNFDPIVPGRYAQWFDRLSLTSGRQRERLIQLMDVGWVLDGVPASISEASYRHVQGAGRVRLLWEARAVASAEEALEIVFSPDFDPSSVLILESSGPLPAVDVESDTWLLEVESLGPLRQSYVVDTAGGAWLFQSDVWYPGWAALVDGVPSPLLRADYLFRAVWVPPGLHTVSFEYRPLTFTLGSAISVLAWLGLLAGLVWWRRR
jgi:hypothetical protein